MAAAVDAMRTEGVAIRSDGEVIVDGDGAGGTMAEQRRWR